MLVISARTNDVGAGLGLLVGTGIAAAPRLVDEQHCSNDEARASVHRGQVEVRLAMSRNPTMSSSLRQCANHAPIGLPAAARATARASRSPRAIARS
jgi:hypothetical protein